MTKDILDDSMLALVQKVVYLRSSDSRRRNLNPLTRSGHKSGIDFEEQGAIGEVYMVWQFFEKTGVLYKLRPSGTFKTERDVGPAEIETIKDPTYNLIIRPCDKDNVPDDTPYVLVLTGIEDNQIWAKNIGWTEKGFAVNHPDTQKIIKSEKDYYWLFPQGLLRPKDELYDLIRNGAYSQYNILGDEDQAVGAT